ncbi:MAG: DUF2066 domain-containing protein [Rhodobiaceae bacterium]|nr:DUF2066 domain-containing protein [Rhodobiaceae bacterium]MCC0041742.1 DUF2066 domain-containing protein [Rhodobiaceae bacterium]
MPAAQNKSWLAPLLSALLCLSLAQRAMAYGDEAYTITGLTVERIAEDAVTAKAHAMDAVYIEALTHLFGRLARSTDRARLPAPNRARAEALIATLSIRDEEAASTRYAVTAEVTFDRQQVLQLFQRAGVRIYDRLGPSAVLIPVRVSDGETRLYADAPGWRDALREAARTPWLVSLSVAQGTMEERLESIESLRALDRVSLDYIRIRNSTQGALIAEFTDATPDSPAHLRVAGDTGAGPFDRTIPIAPDVEDPLGFAANLVPGLLDDHWKQMQSRGAYAGVTINGVLLDGAPLAAQASQPVGAVAQSMAATGAVLAELRLAVAPSDAPARAKDDAPAIGPAPAAAALPRVRPILASATAARDETEIVVALEPGMDLGWLRTALAGVHEIRAFEFAPGDEASSVRLWCWKDRGALRQDLSRNGMEMERDLASNGWRLRRR